MEPMDPSVMVKQAEDLPVVMREQTQPIDMIVRNALTHREYTALRRVFVVGDGDSYHAAMASEMAFENIAKMACEPMSAQRFLDYGAEWMPTPNPNSTLVVGISASGKTQRVISSLEKAKQVGALTLALTGTAGSPLTKMGDRAISRRSCPTRVRAGHCTQRNAAGAGAFGNSHWRNESHVSPGSGERDAQGIGGFEHGD